MVKSMSTCPSTCVTETIRKRNIEVKMLLKITVFIIDNFKNKLYPTYFNFHPTWQA